MHSDCKNEMFTNLNIITNNIQWFTRLFRLCSVHQHSL